MKNIRERYNENDDLDEIRAKNTKKDTKKKKALKAAKSLADLRKLGTSYDKELYQVL